MLRENVRISDTGLAVLSDRELAEKLAKAIIKQQDSLRSGEKIRVDKLSVKLVTSLSDKDLAPTKK